jgi:hypothetical protein
MFIAIVPVISTDDSFFQGTLVALALLVYLTLISVTRPWVFPQLVHIDVIMHLFAIMLIMTGLAFITNENRPTASESIEKTYYVVYLLFFQVGFAGCAVAAICHILYTHRNAYARRLRAEEEKAEAHLIAIDFLDLAAKAQRTGDESVKTLPGLLHKNCVVHDIHVIRDATRILNAIAEADGQWLRRASSLRVSRRKSGIGMDDPNISGRRPSITSKDGAAPRAPRPSINSANGVVEQGAASIGAAEVSGNIAEGSPGSYESKDEPAEV